MDALTFQIVDTIVKAAIAAIMAYVVPVVKRLLNQIMATRWAESAVKAAQQIADIKNMTNEGKKEYAMFELQKLLIKYKIPMTDSQLEMLIESAVKQMKEESMAIDVVDDFEMENIND